MTPIESKPLLTVIIAVFNGIKTLQQCIDSVTQQTYEKKELIIIDGGSRDGTVDLLKANDGKIEYWISEPDAGIYNAWNKGVLRAKGEWIYFLGADDFLWDTHVFDRAVKVLDGASEHTKVAYGQVMLLNEKDQEISVVGEPWEKISARFKDVMCIPHQGVLHRHSLFDRYGLFDDSFRIAGDYELLLRELNTEDAVFIPHVIAGMRQGGISNNPKNSLRAMYEIRRAQKIQGKKWPGKVWISALTRAYIRTWLMSLLGERYVLRLLDAYRRLVGLPAYWTKL